MADITRLARMIGGMPRDIDMTTNSLQVLSLKVGTASPVKELRVIKLAIEEEETF